MCVDTNLDIFNETGDSEYEYEKDIDYIVYKNITKKTKKICNYFYTWKQWDIIIPL